MANEGHDNGQHSTTVTNPNAAWADRRNTVLVNVAQQRQALEAYEGERAAASEQKDLGRRVPRV